MNREFNVAVVIPDFEVLKKWAAEKGLDPIRVAGAERRGPGVDRGRGRQVSAEFKGYEKARRIFIGDEDFTTENGMLTPTLKLKRRVVLQRYNDAIQSLYA